MLRLLSQRTHGVLTPYQSTFDAGISGMPNMVAGLLLWLDSAASLYSDAGSTLATADGTAVYQWNDRSSHANNASQSTSGQRPLLKTNRIAGSTARTVLFDGSNDLMVSGSNTGITGSNSWSVICCLKVITVGFFGHFFCFGVNGSGTVAGLCQMNSSANLVYWSTGGLFDHGDISVTDMTTAYFVISIVYNGTNAKIYQNNSLKYTATGTLTLSNGPVYLSRDAGSSAQFNGNDYVGFCLYDSALSDANRNLVEQYWARRANISF